MANITGTAGDDELNGTAGNDLIRGLGGNDRLFGEAGDDTLEGGDGNDRLYGGEGNDILEGGEGDRDRLRGGAGDDTLDGGAGDRDRAEYGDDPAGVIANLATGTATDGWGDTDTLIGIERLVGSGFADTLTGDDGDNLLRGGMGDDVIDGGGGRDFAQYWDATSAVSINLATGVVTGGAGNDTLISIEEVEGSNFGDTIVGSDADNLLSARHELRGRSECRPGRGRQRRWRRGLRRGQLYERKARTAASASPSIWPPAPRPTPGATPTG
jgi:Ca2+-binding RTX toxin-like protein